MCFDHRAMLQVPSELMDGQGVGRNDADTAVWGWRALGDRFPTPPPPLFPNSLDHCYGALQ